MLTLGKGGGGQRLCGKGIHVGDADKLNWCPVSAALKPFLVKVHQMDVVKTAGSRSRGPGVGMGTSFHCVIPCLHSQFLMYMHFQFITGISETQISVPASRGLWKSQNIPSPSLKHYSKVNSEWHYGKDQAGRKQHRDGDMLRLQAWWNRPRSSTNINQNHRQPTSLE